VHYGLLLHGSYVCSGIITANIMLAAAAVWLLIDFIASPV
jgi:hypothetical protein